MSEGSGWPVEHEVRVAWRDLDAAGHVNNAVYLTYLENARVEAFERHFGVKDPQDVQLILAHASLDFVSPATMSEVLVVRLWPTRIGGSSFTFGYEVTEKTSGRVVLRAESVQVAFDYKRGVKEPVRDAWRKALAAGLVEP